MRAFFLVLLIGLPASVFSQTSLKIVGDTVKIRKKEFILQNASRNNKGFLFNQGDGKTVFKEIGRDLQFTVGSPGYPSPGDSVYTNSYYINKSIKVWRNGLLQYSRVPNGIRIDSGQGRIIFSPELSAYDRIYIEALNGF